MVDHFDNEWQINSATDHWPVTGLRHSSIVYFGEWMNRFSITLALLFTGILTLICNQLRSLCSRITDTEELSASSRHGLQLSLPNLRYNTVGDNFHTMSFPFSVKFQCHVLLFQVRYFDHRWQALYVHFQIFRSNSIIFFQNSKCRLCWQFQFNYIVGHQYII